MPLKSSGSADAISVTAQPTIEVAVNTSDAVRQLNAKLCQRIGSGEHSTTRRRPRRLTRSTNINPILERAGRQARRLLKARRHSLQQELARLGVLKRQQGGLSVPRVRSSRGRYRPSARRAGGSTRGSPADDPSEPEPKDRRRISLRRSSTVMPDLGVYAEPTGEGTPSGDRRLGFRGKEWA